MKVCHVTSVHNPNDIRIFHKECKSLAEKGYEVTLLCANAKTETIDGVNIQGYTLNYKSRLDRFRKSSRITFKAAIKLNADLYHFHDPELLSMGKMLKRAGKKVIFDAHEDLPAQIMAKPYIVKFLRKPLAKLIWNYQLKRVKKFDFLITATPYIANLYRKHLTQVEAINNYPLMGEFAQYQERTTWNNQVCYIGGLTRERGINNLVLSFKNSDFKLKLAGPISENYLKEIKGLSGMENTEYLGILDRAGVVNLLNESSLGTVILSETPNHLNSQPIKLYEYWALGLPVIASSFPFWEKIVSDCKGGICVNPSKPNEIKQAIQDILSQPQLAKEMGINGRKAVEEKYNWDVEKEKLYKIYESLS
jgi:glycosyltransferase involved in cell wall biosynthesis